MQLTIDEYEFSDDKTRIDLDEVCRMLADTYWAADRPRDAIAASIANSLCYGVYCRGAQVGFARVITDHATIFWLCDVVVIGDHQGKGIGRQLVRFALDTPELRHLNAFLATKDAFGLYEKFGFIRSERFMYRPAPTA